MYMDDFFFIRNPKGGEFSVDVSENDNVCSNDDFEMKKMMLICFSEEGSFSPTDHYRGCKNDEFRKREKLTFSG